MEGFLEKMQRLGLANYKIYWYWESDLTELKKTQRIILSCIIMLFSALALIGNILTMFVIIRRKQRPLFRVCIVSLAFSDILYVLFTSTYYLAQFMKPFTSLWVLGPTMCYLIPFVQNITIVANSFTLVMIAFDRYLAVTNCIKEKWQPGVIHSIIICTFIWIFSGLIASGALWNYSTFLVYIIKKLPPESNATIEDYVYKAYICSAEKLVNRKYYTLVFACVFTPTTLVFIMLNSIIAKRIWDRRRPLNNVNVTNGGGIAHRNNTSASNETNSTSLEGNYRKVIPAVSGNVPCPSVQRSNTGVSTNTTGSSYELRKSSSKNLREARHIRMFRVVFVIILIFLLCRLPSWCFLLIKLYSAKSNYSEYWIMHYSFGILVLLNCVLNPLIYTFLSTTLNVWDKLRCWMRCVCRPCLSCHFRGDLKPLNESVTEESAAEVGQYRQHNTSQRN